MSTIRQSDTQSKTESETESEYKYFDIHTSGHRDLFCEQYSDENVIFSFFLDLKLK